MEFDDGDLVDIELAQNGDVAAPKNGKIALIDADTVVFGSVTKHQEVIELLPREMYSDEEWANISSMKTYDPEAGTIAICNMDNAYQSTLEKLQGILDATGCKDWELHFTIGRGSFRYTKIDPMYKANRLEMKSPDGLSELKVKMAETFPEKAFIHYDFEADDAVIAKKKAQPDKYILCAVDKDVLYTLPGRHFNYYSRAATTTKAGNNLDEIKMTFFDVEPEQAMKHHYKQCLTGDTGDNVIGLAKVGPKTADKILAGASSAAECWERVVNEYEARGRDVFDAIKNMRLVSMHQISYDPETDSYSLELWRPEINNKGENDE